MICEFPLLLQEGPIQAETALMWPTIYQYRLRITVFHCIANILVVIFPCKNIQFAYKQWGTLQGFLFCTEALVLLASSFFVQLGEQNHLVLFVGLSFALRGIWFFVLSCCSGFDLSIFGTWPRVDHTWVSSHSRGFLHHRALKQPNMVYIVKEKRCPASQRNLSCTVD